MKAPDTDDINSEEDAKQAPAQEALAQEAPAQEVPAQEVPAQQTPVQQVGEVLRAARLEQGISVQDVARQLRLSVRQIEALEENEYGKLAGGTFLRGFVRNYAKLLQLDEAPLLRLLEQSVPPPPAQILPPQIEGIPFPSNRDRIKRYLIGSGAVLVLLLLVYEIYRGNEATVEKQPSIAPEAKVEPELQSVPLSLPEQPLVLGRQPTEPQLAAPVEKGAIEEREVPPSAPVPVDVPPPPPPREAPQGSAAPEIAGVAASGASANPNAEAAAVPPVPTQEGYGGSGIYLVFDGESRAEVTDGTGKSLLSKLNPPGSEQVLRGQPPYSLTIGNAAQVKLVYNNRPVDLLPYTDPNGGTAHLSLE